MVNNMDLQVDETLEKCILSSPRKSFFLFAGAGSGKTYSLVLLLKKIRNSIIGKDLLLQGKNVAVITFTNAATDEIVNRLDYSPVFHISTIHSFVWDVIKYYQTDIKHLYCQYIQEDIRVLYEKLEKAKSKTTKTYLSNAESQDIKKELVDAFFKIQENFANIFTLGLLGDQKQRIYADGKDNMVNVIPSDWEQPEKKMNYRCAKRIIKLANTIGKDLDIHAEQTPREDADAGLIRLFIVQQHEGINKDEVEQTVMKIMSDHTADEKWFGKDADVKILTLEHMMAARRLGFDQFFGPLSRVTKYQMTFLQGTVYELEFFTKEILPIADSIKEDGRGALEVLKAYSPLLSKQNTEKPYELYLRCREEAGKVANMVNKNHTIREVVKSIWNSQLLTVLEVIRQASTLVAADITEEMEEDLQAWVMVMDLPINMVRGYDDYVNQRTRFDTHQGVKGLEFDRVMVIIDDSEARGFMFSYDKLFGVKELTETDIRHIEAGKESSVDRTQRLFYVTCTRAKESLAIVMYTSDSEKVKNQAINKGWFSEQEIIPLKKNE